MRFPRFRPRTLVIAVLGFAVILAVGVEAVRLARASTLHSKRAAEFAKSEAAYTKLADDFEKFIAQSEDAEADYLELKHEASDTDDAYLFSMRTLVVAQVEAAKAKIAQCKKKAAWNATMKQKYEKAASRPWLKVAKDTPEPG